jgi:hypothetical protein
MFNQQWQRSGTFETTTVSTSTGPRGADPSPVGASRVGGCIASCVRVNGTMAGIPGNLNSAGWFPVMVRENCPDSASSTHGVTRRSFEPQASMKRLRAVGRRLFGAVQSTGGRTGGRRAARV